MAIAQTAAWHIAKAAETAGAKVCIAVFHSRPSANTAITIVKPWECACQDRAAVLGAVEPLGGTPMSPAILAASGMLAEVNATRHILMVLTDGKCDYGPAAVTRACVLAGDAGVEVVGVGIACASVIAAFPPRYSVSVENLAQLAQAGLGTLVAMLEDANPRGAD
jgi:Mg-chelatase subunit ChlD